MTKPMKDRKLVAYIIEPIRGRFEMVNQTEYFDDGTWLTGMNLITSLEDVFERAWKKKINVIPASCFKEKLKNND